MTTIKDEADMAKRFIDNIHRAEGMVDLDDQFNIFEEAKFRWPNLILVASPFLVLVVLAAMAWL